jgi:hypothetical protein
VDRGRGRAILAATMTVPVARPLAVSTASANLLSAALAGLLCLTGCSKDEPDPGAENVAGDPAHITSSKNVGVMTEAQFTALCDERGGTVEVMPHCGGFATAKGFSYDSTTEELSEHTCRGANTCAGWNCVVPD